jgi:hypothetical protein
MVSRRADRIRSFAGGVACFWQTKIAGAIAQFFHFTIHGDLGKYDAAGRDPDPAYLAVVEAP